MDRLLSKAPLVSQAWEFLARELRYSYASSTSLLKNSSLHIFSINPRLKCLGPNKKCLPTSISQNYNVGTRAINLKLIPTIEKYFIIFLMKSNDLLEKVVGLIWTENFLKKLFLHLSLCQIEFELCEYSHVFALFLRKNGKRFSFNCFVTDIL